MEIIETTNPAAGASVPGTTPAAVADESMEQGDQYLANVASETIPLGDFIREFGQGLLEQVRMQHPPVYQQVLDKETPVWWQRHQILNSLRRKRDLSHQIEWLKHDFGGFSFCRGVAAQHDPCIAVHQRRAMGCRCNGCQA